MTGFHIYAAYWHFFEEEEIGELYTSLPQWNQRLRRLK
jgi:hypothetical protein